MLVRIDEPKRLTVAERFRGQRDLLTGDDVVPSMPLPLISLPNVPSKPLTKSQIMSLYNELYKPSYRDPHT